MNGKLEGSNEKNWLRWGGLYAVILLALMMVLNYTVPYSSGPVTTLEPWLLLAWGLLYLPIVILPIAARCKVSDFGFTLSPYLALAFILVTMLCTLVSMRTSIPWGTAAIEAFARTGEEVFFRGFLIVFFMRLFGKQRRPWLWAALACSLLFALAHTQTFQPAFLSQYDAPTTPVLYKIIERLANVFISGLILALLRVWTRSILPGAVAHGILNLGIQTLPFVLVIYFLGILWAYKRGEQVVFRSGGQAN
jgi:membrane protease YdiL (CAAX protease family)